MPGTDQDIVRDLLHRGTPRMTMPASMATQVAARQRRSDGVTYAMYESRGTGAVLETAVTYPPGFPIVTPQDPHGTVKDVEATVYLSISRSDTVPPGPSRR